MKRSLVWDEWNISHIRKHNVSREEVEEVYVSSPRMQISYKGRKVYFGQTKQGRLLTIIVATENNYVLSARDMSKKERRGYYEQTKTN